jgi:hypothetical protein
MGGPYSQDLRERVIGAGGFRDRSVCCGFGVPGKRFLHVQGPRSSSRDRRDDGSHGEGWPQAEACSA